MFRGMSFIRWRSRIFSGLLSDFFLRYRFKYYNPVYIKKQAGSFHIQRAAIIDTSIEADFVSIF